MHSMARPTTQAVLPPARQGPSGLVQLKTLQTRYLPVPLCPQFLSSCTSSLRGEPSRTAGDGASPVLSTPACVTQPYSPREQSWTDIRFCHRTE